ncbi:MAG TPA: hypothetical protein DCG12_20120 [Planctomycetaceae bacterium]|nr:hypothetical protein [Planctomycetaceae bacterium]
MTSPHATIQLNQAAAHGRRTQLRPAPLALSRVVQIVSLLLFFSLSCTTADDTTEQQRFFEAKIRPVLVEHCYKCHSADSKKVEGGLLLDTAAGSRAGGESGPAVVPGKPNESLLLDAVRYQSFEMPPNQQLPESIVADLEKWIRDGAHDPRSGEHSITEDEIDIEAGRKFWAFQPPQPSAFLEGQDTSDSARIDALIQRHFKDRGLTANIPADRRTLLRRLHFDLTGLPPTHEEVLAFQQDKSADAIQKVVDDLLSRKTYGQRWARVWLDLSRFAEDQAHIVGNNKSLFYPNAWRYRDWVIDALNNNIPYDQFIRLQLAADLIDSQKETHRAALGFIGLGPKYYRRNDLAVMAEEWEDRVDVVSRGLQGITVACARCHDHKYDPIRTEDYYALAGVFASTEMFNQPGSKKDKKDPENSLHIIREGKAQDLAVMIRGKVDHRGDVVPRGFLQVMFPGERKSFSKGSGRLELAECITDPANPLTARVIVNRIWQQYFGTGLVATPSNFGQLGQRPSHPELLDDLAVRFVQNGWDLKWLHRQIALSSAYQRSSDINAASMETDPTNKWLWRMPRRRLPIEGWRDAVLTAAGRIDVDTGGQSIQPDDPVERRRTVYSAVSRFDLNPLLARFDFPDPNVHAARRVETNTPLQKLFLLNNLFIIKQARYTAELVSGGTNEETVEAQLVTALFAQTLQREPDEVEFETAVQFLKNQPTALPQLAQSLLVSNEFWYLD